MQYRSVSLTGYKEEALLLLRKLTVKFASGSVIPVVKDKARFPLPSRRTNGRYLVGVDHFPFFPRAPSLTRAESLKTKSATAKVCCTTSQCPRGKGQASCSFGVIPSCDWNNPKGRVDQEFFAIRCWIRPRVRLNR